MGRKVIGPMCCATHVNEPSARIEQEKGFAHVFLTVAAECAVAPCKPLTGHYKIGSQNSSLQ